jgi:CubicO group peptidase (beta-lactamase class C family)
MTADELARFIVTSGVSPSAAAAVGAYAGPRGGWRSENGGAVDLFFDLASVTKPMTAVAIARAGIDRRAPLGAILPEARGTASEHLPLELFLAHRAGLKAHLALHLPLLDGRKVEIAAALGEAADARRADAAGPAPAEGFAPLYSDLGYILAGAALARAVAARDAGEAIARLVLEPLGVGSQAGTVRDLAERGVRGPFAPTEQVAWRGGLVAGAVHDENAWALTGGGGSGHAGLFGTADAVLRFGRAVHDALAGRGSCLGGSELGWLVRERPGGTLRAGFDGKSAEGSSAGARMGPRSFGHLGFTGTSLWIDPDREIVVTLLTNRVSPTREHMAIRDARPWAHDQLWARGYEISRVAP